MSLLTDLRDAQAETPCALCDLIRSERGATADALREAAGGTIGVRKLANIMRRNSTGVGERTIMRHRREEHTP